MLFTLVTISLGVLWFLDEILTLKDIAKYGVSAEKNPVIRNLMKHGKKTILWFKITTFAVFVALAYIVHLMSNLFFFALAAVLVVVYLFVDFHNFQVLSS